jgi:uncharacterized alkaline shock family protein YloU
MTVDDHGDALECGTTIDTLSDYLDRNRTPADAHIENCPECLNALEVLERVGRLSRDLIDAEVAELPDPPESWFERIFTSIQEELRAGRSFPVSHPDPRVQITVTEGAVRALLRDTGDSVDGVIISRTEIVGDAETLGAPVEINLTASVRFGTSIQQLSDELRAVAYAALATHTDLNVAAVNVTVANVHTDIEGTS